jgi:uncharacterized membrane protein
MKEEGNQFRRLQVVREANMDPLAVLLHRARSNRAGDIRSSSPAPNDDAIREVIEYLAIGKLLSFLLIFILILGLITFITGLTYFCKVWMSGRHYNSGNLSRIGFRVWQQWLGIFYVFLCLVSALSVVLILHGTFVGIDAGI